VRRAAQAGIAMEQLTRAFVTHLHSDHTVGLPDLIFTPAVTGRREPFEIYGPPGTRAMTAHILQAYREDRQIRLHGLEPSVAQAYVVHAHDVAPGEIYRDGTVRVIAFAVNHGSWKHAYGYRFEAPDKTIVLSGDTTYSPALIAAAKGCDILVQEVYSEKGLQNRTADWQRYHRAFHTSGPDAGRVAAAVQPKTLVLYHQLPMGQSPEEILEEVRREFSGTTVYGKDLDVIR
jgi:ribonuclease Z